MSHEGLQFCVERYFAYLSDDGISWDAAMAVNDAKTHLQDDPWSGDDRYDEKRQAIFEFWNDIPEFNRAWFEVVGVVPFDQILDIDDLGDEYVQAPHVYVAFAPGENGPFKKFVAQVETIGRWDRRSFQPGDRSDGRIEHFPGVLRKLDDKSE